MEVYNWLEATFGSIHAMDYRQRYLRFFEEAVELVQSHNGTKEECYALVDMVFSKSPGRIFQEVGGVMTTLAALCENEVIDMFYAGTEELKNMWKHQAEIEAKSKQKTL